MTFTKVTDSKSDLQDQSGSLIMVLPISKPQMISY